jgi:hypothetical protein
MTRTFLVAIELPNDADVNAEAEQIQFLLSDDYEVTSVKPWASPSTPQPTFEDIPSIL